MSVINVFLHFVWATKNRTPFLITPEIRKSVWQHIETNAKTKDIYVLETSGHKDHCHCIVSLSKDMNISKIAQLLKGECSYWINKSGLITEHFREEKFDWQEDYFVESISPHLLQSVRNYLYIQEEHLKTHSFEEEYQNFFKEFKEGNLPT